MRVIGSIDQIGLLASETYRSPFGYINVHVYRQPNKLLYSYEAYDLRGHRVGQGRESKQGQRQIRFVGVGPDGYTDWHQL